MLKHMEARVTDLAKLLSNFDRVFVDTCSLMEDSFPRFYDDLKESKRYWKKGLRILILDDCYAEIEKHINQDQKQSARIEAMRALEVLKQDKKHLIGRVFTHEKTGTDFFDSAVTSLVNSLRLQYKILIITQDKTLAYDLQKLNEMESQKGRFLRVYRLNPDAILEPNYGEAPTHPGARGTTNRFEGKTKPVREPKKTEKKPVSETNELSIQEVDNRLSASLPNPIYPLERKLSDIDAQIAAIQAAPKEGVPENLRYPLERLSAEKERLSALPKEEKPVEEKKPALKPHFEIAPTVEEAMYKLAAYHSWIFREKGIRYSAKVHGPYNINAEEVKAFAESVGEVKGRGINRYELKGLLILISAAPRGVKVSFDIPKAEEKNEEIAEKPAPKAEEKPAEAPVEEKRADDLNKKVLRLRKTPSKAVAESSLEEIRHHDFLMRAKINNPTYPNAAKIRDLEEQKKRLSGINAEQAEGLVFTKAEIDKRLKALKAE